MSAEAARHALITMRVLVRTDHVLTRVVDTDSERMLSATTERARKHTRSEPSLTSLPGSRYCFEQLLYSQLSMDGAFSRLALLAPLAPAALLRILA